MARHAIMLWLAFACATAGASTLDVLNEARTRSCGLSPPPAALARSKALDEVAKAIAAGADLDGAFASAGVRSHSRAYVRFDAIRSDRDLRKQIGAQACVHLANRDYDEVGHASRGRALWVVLAKRFAPPLAAEYAKVSGEMLQEVNRARTSARRCGAHAMPAAPPLLAEARLDAAAREYAQLMASADRFDHIGTDGSSAADRVRRTGYAWRLVGENLAAGPTTVGETVQGWLDSPGHCENLMDARFTQMGIGYAVNPASRQGVYWVQVLATPAN